jgi:hypothetical protein
VRDFDDSTLWRISAYEQLRAQSGNSGFLSLQKVLPMPLSARLRSIEKTDRAKEVMEVLAACLRQRESALLLLRHLDMVWPLTLFPQAKLYHSPQPILETLRPGLRELQVIAVEPPGLRPPGQRLAGDSADDGAYRPLLPLLWALALCASRAALLQDIGGRAAYRVAADFNTAGVRLPGALDPALQRLRREIASLADIALWPGMDRDRAARLLNGVYLQGNLIILRSHPAARDSGAQDKGLRRWWRPAR